ncbi:MAG: alpha/beta fold hydrolase [Bryobacteraceae bacterium]|nr:alpha/beta fold hydrolase [Bryobacteraceae bacterium]
MPELIEHRGIRGTLHRVSGSWWLALAHGAGTNSNAPLLVAVAEALEQHGVSTLRIDLPFRQARAKGPPFPAQAAADRAGIREAAAFLRSLGAAKVAVGGHSYGGRQASMLASEDPDAASALLLISYPLHPPGQPEKARTAHFPQLGTPALFLSGSRDDFGSPPELQAAVAAIPAHTRIEFLEGQPHSLRPRIAERIAESFSEFVGAL